MGTVQPEATASMNGPRARVSDHNYCIRHEALRSIPLHYEQLRPE